MKRLSLSIPTSIPFEPNFASKLLFLVLLPALIAGCALNINMVNHDETKAEERGRALLEALYVRKNFEQAPSQFDPAVRGTVTESSLRRLVSTVTREFGPIVSIQYERWLPVLGKKSVTVMFVINHKSGRSYHRIELHGDANGYLAGDISFSSQPFRD